MAPTPSSATASGNDNVDKIPCSTHDAAKQTDQLNQIARSMGAEQTDLAGKCEAKVGTLSFAFWGLVAVGVVLLAGAVLIRTRKPEATT